MEVDRAVGSLKHTAGQRPLVVRFVRFVDLCRPVDDGDQPVVGRFVGKVDGEGGQVAAAGGQVERVADAVRGQKVVQRGAVVRTVDGHIKGRGRFAGDVVTDTQGGAVRFEILQHQVRGQQPPRLELFATRRKPA